MRRCALEAGRKILCYVWVRERKVLKEKDLNQNYQSACTQGAREFSGSPRAALSICSGMDPVPVIGLFWL